MCRSEDFVSIQHLCCKLPFSLVISSPDLEDKNKGRGEGGGEGRGGNKILQNTIAWTRMSVSELSVGDKWIMKTEKIGCLISE